MRSLGQHSDAELIDLHITNIAQALARATSPHGKRGLQHMQHEAFFGRRQLWRLILPRLANSPMNRHRIPYEDGRSRYNIFMTMCANEWKRLVNPADVISYLAIGACFIYRGRVGKNRIQNFRHAHSTPVGRDTMSHSSIIVYLSRPQKKEHRARETIGHAPCLAKWKACMV